MNSLTDQDTVRAGPDASDHDRRDVVTDPYVESVKVKALVREVFPGQGLSRPTDEQWELADSIVGRPLERQWRPQDKPHFFASWWRNLAYLRSQINRHLVTLPAAEINKILDRIEGAD